MQPTSALCAAQQTYQCSISFVNPNLSALGQLATQESFTGYSVSPYCHGSHRFGR